MIHVNVDKYHYRKANIPNTFYLCEHVLGITLIDTAIRYYPKLRLS